MTKNLIMLAETALIIALCLVPAYGAGFNEEVLRLCSQIDTADTLSAEELKTMITDSEELIKNLNESNEPKKKLFLFRLNKCLDFYKYTSDSMSKGTGSK